MVQPASTRPAAVCPMFAIHYCYFCGFVQTKLAYHPRFPTLRFRRHFYKCMQVVRLVALPDQGFIYDLQHALVNLEREPKQFATGATSGLLSFAYSAPPQPFESPASAGGLHPLPKAGNPARIPSQLSAAATDPGMSSASRSVGRLDVLSSTPAALSGRAPCIHARGCAALRRNLVRNAG
jgi:hypothetical protein